MDKNCFFKGVLTGRALKARNTGANAAESNVVLSPVSALNYDKSSFLAGLSVGMGLKGWTDRGNAFGGDYSGTAPELGYAWCLGKAVPVYKHVELVSNPQYARFYISELPAFSAADYPYITISFNVRLLRFTEKDFLSLMSRGTFITKTGFPFMAMLHRTDRPKSTPYGYNWIGAGDDRAYAIGNYTDTQGLHYAPTNIEYFDFYLTGNDNAIVKSAIRYNGEKNKWHFNFGAGVTEAGRDGPWLTLNNIGEYLVLTKTPNGIIMN